MLFIRRLRWTEWSVLHIARHGVTPDEVEEVCHGDPLVSETYNDRLRLIGPTAADRMLTVILAPEGDGVFFPITARPASRNERALHQREKGGEPS